MSIDAKLARERLREERKKYLDNLHRTKKHRAAAHGVLKAFIKQVKKGHDGWTLLESLDKANGDTVTASELKAALRDQLVPLQGNRCCYCRRWLMNSAYARPIDHILPRSPYKRFSLHFLNLAIACVDCNSLKTNTIWGNIGKTRRAYPRYEEIVDWFHPRYHRYDEHIHYVRYDSNQITVVIFLGLTAQGRHLCKSLLSEVAATEMMLANNPAMNSYLTAFNGLGDNVNESKARHLREFQDEMNRSLVRMLGSKKP